MVFRNADPELAWERLSWGDDAFWGSPPEPQGRVSQEGCAQGSGSFHTHGSIPPRLTCLKMKVTGELRFWVSVLLIKAEVTSVSRMGGGPSCKPLCVSFRTACFSGSGASGAPATNLPIPGMEARPTTEGSAGQGQYYYLGVPIGALTILHTVFQALILCLSHPWASCPSIKPQ